MKKPKKKVYVIEFLLNEFRTQMCLEEKYATGDHIPTVRTNRQLGEAIGSILSNEKVKPDELDSYVGEGVIQIVLSSMANNKMVEQFRALEVFFKKGSKLRKKSKTVGLGALLTTTKGGKTQDYLIVPSEAPLKKVKKDGNLISEDVICIPANNPFAQAAWGKTEGESFKHNGADYKITKIL